MEALLRYPKHKRRAMAQELARRSNAVQSAARMLREPDFETQRHRALDDARGQVVREGVTYFGDGTITRWQVRRSVHGRTDQFDIITNDRLFKTCGPRKLPNRIRP